MSNESISEKIIRLKNEIAALPKGYISRKNIHGKIRSYRQWTEDGKIKSQYIKDSDLAETENKILQRKELETELKNLSKSLAADSFPDDFETNVIVGQPLMAMTENVRKWEKRDCYEQLNNYLYSAQSDTVCLVFGLRRTGKTTLLRQSIGEMSEENFAKAVYIKANKSNTIADINKDLKKLYSAGYKFVFVDEVTLIWDFIDSAAIFSDIYAAQGMKIVLSGTDSLGFWFALHQELYDRAVTLHTTFIPFHEHCRLLGTDNIDEYIRYGGTLRAGETNFDDRNAVAEDATFRDDESTRRYIDTAICRNIQNSLACCEDGGHFRHLASLYEAGELTSAINRIVEDINHKFVLKVLTEDFKSHDLGLSVRNLRKEKNPDVRTDILDCIDKETVTKKLMEILDIRNEDERNIGITNAHISEIKEYLKALDLIVDCPIKTTSADSQPIEHILFTQPGMRYCQAQALVFSLMKDPVFSAASELEKRQVTEKILEEVRGRMAEEIILLETMKTFGGLRDVFKLQFAAGEFDMVLYDPDNHSCEIYEIKHSSKIAEEQYRHLADSEKLDLTLKRFGTVSKRCVLYKGGELTLDNGIEYKNIEEYLTALPEIRQAMDMEGPDIGQTMSF